MKTLSVKRIALPFVAAAAVLPFNVNPVTAAAQGAGSPIVGTWSIAQPDGQGGRNTTYFIYGQDGSYRMVSIIQGGPHSGSETQRWGSYQWQSTGPGQGIASVRVTGGAPQQICTQGSDTGCTSVQGIQQNARYQLQVQGNQLREGNAIFRRDQVPQQLMAQLPPTRYVQGPTAPTLHPYVTPGRNLNNGEVTNIPGLGRNCDDLQQQRICTYGNGGVMVRVRATGCLVCQKY